MSDEAIVEVRRADRAALAALLAEHAGVTLAPDALVVGFARRFATYKRANLLLRQAATLAELLADDDRPIHFVFAGKAHPADGPGKSLLADIVAYGKTAAANSRFSFVPDYDMAVARALYFGSDVWLNNPVRPREASGTSGEKAALNGGLNCSILDGWWAEMSDNVNGFDIPTSELTDESARDDEESAAALALLAEVAALLPCRRSRHAVGCLGRAHAAQLVDTRPEGAGSPHGRRLRPAALPADARRPTLRPAAGVRVVPDTTRTPVATRLVRRCGR